ncbi:GH1 family beta-glucosidase [Saccharopolyspora sp. CA-218241]|uniref:GH1 family beta-glucosidase n=1 Tax=Saccharopolyspora sp. CA-218241 TaxID=3240027 RepID=UPI003D95684F
MDGLAGFPVFPPDFRFGVATAAYQVEGAVAAGGRGRSIWDTFAATPGRVHGGDTGEVACDHYHRYPEDIGLMRALGVDAYRFSIAWPRIQPEGSGPGLAAGLDFYSRLVDELLAADIEPFPTLYHWDLPQALEDRGGWRERDTAQRFADYAALVHRRLGDRVGHWTTLNEPYCTAFVGHAEGRHAPGTREGAGALRAAHHLLVAHGLAVTAMREQRHGDERFGITLNLNSVRPAGDDPADLAAARRQECLSNRVFTDPVLAGRHPEAEHETWGELTDFGFRRDGDLALASTPLDFLGVNNYFPEYVRAAPHEQPDPARRDAADIGAAKVHPEWAGATTMGWPVEPAGLGRVLRWLRAEYPGLPPIHVTENGTSGFDEPDEAGRVADPHRIGYLDGHLRAVREAIADGVDVRGYFCWSLLDNFEWAHGYRQRFGLVHVDYADQRRTPKDSFDWYRRAIRTARG